MSWQELQFALGQNSELRLYNGGEFSNGYTVSMGPLVVGQFVDSFRQCARATLPQEFTVERARTALGLSLLDFSLMFGQALTDTQNVRDFYLCCARYNTGPKDTSMAFIEESLWYSDTPRKSTVVYCSNGVRVSSPSLCPEGTLEPNRAVVVCPGPLDLSQLIGYMNDLPTTIDKPKGSVAQAPLQPSPVSSPPPSTAPASPSPVPVPTPVPSPTSSPAVSPAPATITAPKAIPTTNTSTTTSPTTVPTTPINTTGITTPTTNTGNGTGAISSPATASTSTTNGTGSSEATRTVPITASSDVRSSSTSSSSSSNTLSTTQASSFDKTPAVLGIVIAVVFTVVLLAAAALLMLQRHKKEQARLAASQADAPVTVL